MSGSNINIDTNALSQKVDKNAANLLKNLSVQTENGKTKILGFEVSPDLAPFAPLINIAYQGLIEPVANAIGEYVYRGSNSLANNVFKTDLHRSHTIGMAANIVVSTAILGIKPLSKLLSGGRDYAVDRSKLYEEFRKVRESTGANAYNNEVIQVEYQRAGEKMWDVCKSIGPEIPGLIVQGLSLGYDIYDQGEKRYKYMQDGISAQEAAQKVAAEAERLAKRTPAQVAEDAANEYAEQLAKTATDDARKKAANTAYIEGVAKAKAEVDQAEEPWIEKATNHITDPKELESKKVDAANHYKELKPMLLQGDMERLEKEKQEALKSPEQKAQEAQEQIQLEEQKLNGDKKQKINWFDPKTYLFDYKVQTLGVQAAASEALQLYYDRQLEKHQQSKHPTAWQMIQKLKRKVDKERADDSTGVCELSTIDPQHLLADVKAIFLQHELDIGRGKFTGPSNERALDQASLLIAEAIADGRLNALALVNLVGERKIIVPQDNERTVVSKQDVRDAIDQLQPKLGACAVPSAKEFFEHFDNAKETKEQLKNYLKAMPEGIEKDCFAFIFTYDVLKEAGWTQEQAVDAHTRAKQHMRDVVERSLKEIASKHKDELGKFNLTEHDLRALKKIGDVFENGSKKEKETVLNSLINGQAHALLQNILGVVALQELQADKDSWVERVKGKPRKQEVMNGDGAALPDNYGHAVRAVREGEGQGFAEEAPKPREGNYKDVHVADKAATSGVSAGLN